jgi:alkanesulfonate monooxygenase SsuD/methylene tetrahydromethanopterin reductase-like flavin-dependent oxidoreductase (luciferase family)
MTDLGVVFRPQHPPELLRPTAEAADRSGVDELWVWEDCFDEGGISAAAAALAWTERLHVGIGVLPVPLRNVALSAMEIATLARLFPGRVEVGLGHGVQEWMGQIGVRAASPMTLLREYLAALQQLLAGDKVDFEGRYVSLRDVTLGWPPHEKPRLHVGAVKPKTVALAGELGDGLVLTAGSTPDDVRAARAVYDAARGERSGHVTVYLMTLLGPDADARRDAEARHWGLDPATDLAAAGDGAAVAAAVQRWAEAGADTVVLQPPADENPVTFARFAGEEVRPRLR